MLVPMAKVHVVGHQRMLDTAISVLQRLQMLHLVDVTEDESVALPPLAVGDVRLQELEELRYLRLRLDSLLALSSVVPVPAPGEEIDLEGVRQSLEADGPHIEQLVSRLDELEAEMETLPRHLETLRRLRPLVPRLTRLEGYETVALVLDARHADVLADLNARLTDMLEGRFELFSGRVEPDTVGAILVFPRRNRDDIESMLGGERVSRVRLPRRYEDVPFQQAIADMERRLEQLPGEMSATVEEIDRLVRPHSDWATASSYISARLEQLEVMRRLGATPHTFILSGWVPRRDLDRLRDDLEEGAGGEVILEVVDDFGEARPPVLLENPETVRPFQHLVRLLDLPRYGTLDPTGLMGFFLPLFFGMMLGDVVYGALLLLIAGVATRRLRDRSPILADVGRVLMISAGWTLVWGVIYAEALGDLGRRILGVEPLWIDREQALTPLLVFATAVGAAHVLLGLALGIWSALKTGERKEMGERIATLVSLVGLFLLAGATTGQLPAGLTTPGAAVAIVGLVVLMALEGGMGILMGPLELIGTIGNILSYLRIAAIGLASVYLARVANELGAVGPLWLGIFVATLLHALNLALGTFSPTIQALRLHYVEFFDKFFAGGGEAFRPVGGSADQATPGGR